MGTETKSDFKKSIDLIIKEMNKPDEKSVKKLTKDGNKEKPKLQKRTHPIANLTSENRSGYLKRGGDV